MCSLCSQQVIVFSAVYRTSPKIMYANLSTLGILIAIVSCLTDVSQGQSCIYRFYGKCRCIGQYYDRNTCLPDAHGCRIQLNTDTALAKPLYNNQKPTSIYSCAPGNSSPRYEVHVLAMYEGNRHTRPPTAGDTTVNIVNRSDRPIILVLGSYEPVNWILSLPADIVISKVILAAYYIDQSSVSGDRIQAVERKGRQWGMGFGTDSGGGDTPALLRQVYNKFGVVTSFTGTYKADEWTLKLSSPHTPLCQNCTSLSEAIQKLTKMVKQLKQQVDSQEQRVTALERGKNRT